MNQNLTIDKYNHMYEIFDLLRKAANINDDEIKILLTNPEFEAFYDIIQYMLNNNCKLEQEILD